MDRFDIHQKVILHYGEIAQIRKCKEELKELADELDNCAKMYGTGSKQKLISEIADVLNTLEQQCFIHGIFPVDLSAEQDRKMQRTLDRINNLEVSNGIDEV